MRRVGLALLAAAAILAGCSLAGRGGRPPARFLAIASQNHFHGELLPNG